MIVFESINFLYLYFGISRDIISSNQQSIFIQCCFSFKSFSNFYAFPRTFVISKKIKLYLDAQLPAELIQLLLVVGRHLGGGPQVLVQLLNRHLVVHALALKHLHLLEDLVGLLGGQGELGDGVGEVLLGLLRLLLHQHDATRQGGNVGLYL